MNQFEKYYIKQAGCGLSGFAGVKYQKGFGFFGRLMSGAILPFLRFLGKNALNTGANIAKDIVDSDDFSLENIKEISKSKIKDAGKEMIKKANDKLQKGNGIKRKLKTKKIRTKAIKVIKKNKKVFKKKNKAKAKAIKRIKKNIKSSKKSFLD